MGKFGDMLNNIRAAANEAAQKRKAEQQALHERMKQYYRGYDVFPDEVNTQYTDWVRRSLIKGLVIKSLILAALIALGVTAFGAKAYDVFPVYMIGGFVALILLLFVITDISLLTRFLKGNYDCFGAMVTNTRVESHTSTDSDGNTTTTYDYYVSLNGIECEVDSKQYRKAAVGQYMHFVRLKAKYRKNDRFYFFPCSEDEEYYLIGHHNPRTSRGFTAPKKARQHSPHFPCCACLGHLAHLSGRSCVEAPSFCVQCGYFPQGC